MKPIYVAVNEFNVLGVAFQVWRHKPVRLLRSLAVLPPLQFLVDRMVNWLLSRPGVSWAVDEFPALKPYWEYDRRFFFREVFKQYEPWQDAYFDFPALDDDDPYDFSYKQIVTNYMFRQVMNVHILDAIETAHEPGSYTVRGLNRDAIALYESFFGRKASAQIRAAATPHRMINTVLPIVLALYSVFWLASKTRLNHERRDFTLMSDFNGDPRDFEIYKKIATPDDTMIVPRSQAFVAPLMALRPGAQYCLLDAGRFTPADALQAYGLIVTGLWTLWRRFGHRNASIFYFTATLPVRRARIRGLFNRYRAKYYWGRDEYNVDHILRLNELHRVGGVSLGLCHAIITNFCSLIPQWRYVAFDIYYVFSIPFVEPYVDRWRKGMQLRSAGIFSLPEDRLKERWPKGDAILITMRVAWLEPEMIRMARAVAQAFPERRIVLQIKAGYIDDVSVDTIFDSIAHGLDNVVSTTQEVFNLIEEAQYLISDVSTLIGETVQLGIPTLFADVVGQESTCFWALPGLTVNTAEQAVEKLKALESGDWVFPHADYLRRMDLDKGKNIFDLISDDTSCTNDANRTVNKEAQR